MRWTVAVAVVALVAGEGRGLHLGSTGPTGPELRRPGAAPARDTDATRAVRAAEAATRTKGTARFVVECRATYEGGSFTVRREGVYDVANDRAAYTQTTSGGGSGPVAEVFAPYLEPHKRTAFVVVDGKQGYMRLPSWPASLRERWKTFEDQSNLIGVDADVEVFPAAVDLLSGTRGARSPRTGGVHLVEVSPFAALLGLPALCAPGRLLGGHGISLSKVPFDVGVAAEVRDGLVTAVSYDLADVLLEGWRLDGLPGDPPPITSLTTTVTLTGHGEPVSIKVPSGPALIRPGELRA